MVLKKSSRENEEKFNFGFDVVDAIAKKDPDKLAMLHIDKNFNERRFTFGGDTARDQRIYFINTKEIMGNKYGTPAPVPFRVVDPNIGLDLEASLRCNGEYSYQIADPILFYKSLAANVTGNYTRDMLDSQLKSQFLTCLQPAKDL